MLTFGRTASCLFSIYSKSQSNSVEPHCPLHLSWGGFRYLHFRVGDTRTSTWHDITYPSHSVFSSLVQPMFQFLESVESQTFQRQRGHVAVNLVMVLMTLMYHFLRLLCLLCHDLMSFCLSLAGVYFISCLSLYLDKSFLNLHDPFLYNKNIDGREGREAQGTPSLTACQLISWQLVIQVRCQATLKTTFTTNSICNRHPREHQRAAGQD